MHDLVSSEWLAGALGAPDLMVFDATKYLPNEPFDGLTKYREAHIPGARFFDIDVVADPDTTLPHMAPTAGRFARLMGEMGISNTTRVIFYDQKGLQSSARGWWLMKLFGHEKTAVLDGGLPKWLAEGRTTESGDAKPATPTSYTPDFHADLLKGIGDGKAEAGGCSQHEVDLDLAYCDFPISHEIAVPDPNRECGCIKILVRSR
jgi:thiosulfate/3-mercaptopyruvate sulfurtransferase